MVGLDLRELRRLARTELGGNRTAINEATGIRRVDDRSHLTTLFKSLLRAGGGIYERPPRVVPARPSVGARRRAAGSDPWARRGESRVGAEGDARCASPD